MPEPVESKPRSVGLTYEGDERPCSVHGGYEMEHTCAGGPGEPLGYCSRASDAVSCLFADRPSTERQEPPK